MKPLNRHSLKNTNAEGTYLGGRYLLPSEVTHCLRCGIARMTRSNRPAGLCMDCRGIETRAAKETPEPLTVPLVKTRGGIWKLPPAPMSLEDRAWCERQANAHFWTRWETDNRAGTVTETTIREAIRRTETIQQPTRKVA